MTIFQRRDISLKELVNGDQLSIAVFEFQGKKPGPHVHIQASVHGAEVQGNLVIYELMQFFSRHEFAGKITFIPCSNPMGINSKSGTSTLGRFNTVTGDNWNRVFEDVAFDYDDFVSRHLSLPWKELKDSFKKEFFQTINSRLKTLEERGLSENKKWALTLQKEASLADIVLDLHTGPISTSYLYTAEEFFSSSLDLNFPHHIIIPAEFEGAMDEATFMPWIKLKKALAKAQRSMPSDTEVYTLELGSEETINSDRAKRYSLSLLHYLKKRGVVTSELPPLDVITKRYKTKLAHYRCYHAPHGGLVEYLKAPGEVVLEGEAMASFFNFKTITALQGVSEAQKIFKAPKDALIINRCPSSNVTQGMELFFVMEEFELI